MKAKRAKMLTVAGSLGFDGFKDRIRKVQQLEKEFNKNVRISVLDDIIYYESTFEDA